MLSDNTSGSRQLLQSLNTFLEQHQNQIDSDILELLENHFIDFQSINSYLKKFRNAFEKKLLKNFFAENKINNEKIFNRIFENLQPHIDGFTKFITISNSKTILEVIKLIHKQNKNIHLIISEGRPILEGNILAENLSSSKIKTALITEAQIYNEYNILIAVLSEPIRFY